ncbi:MAG: hypothetical protein M1488_01375 [Gammaproteobacteria bacterium]|nr:hypothetical protein [Gammaproteobacteria bacterium]
MISLKRVEADDHLILQRAEAGEGAFVEVFLAPVPRETQSRKCPVVCLPPFVIYHLTP